MLLIATTIEITLMWITGLIVCLGWILSLCFHEFSHALVAYWGGDTSVKDKGYLTFNPLKYTQPGLSIILPLVLILIGGIGLPGGAVYINHRLLKNRCWDSLVSAAGPASNVLFALILIIPFWLLNSDLDTQIDFWSNSTKNLVLDIIYPSLAYLIYIEIFAVILNSLPIPSFDGYGIISPWLPEKINRQLNKYGNYSYYLIFGLFLFVPAFGSFISQGIIILARTLGVPIVMFAKGTYLFAQPVNKLIAILIIIVLGYLLKFNENTWYQKGNKLARQQKEEEAIASYDKAIKIKPNYADAWLRKADCYYRLKNYQQAAQSYQEVIKIEPDKYDAWLYLGHAYSLDKKDLQATRAYQQAIATLTTAIENNPQNHHLWLLKAQSLYNLGNYQQTIEILQETIKLDPEEYEAWLYLGHAYFSAENYQQAVDAYQQAIKLESDEINHQSYYYLARSLQNLDRTKEAIALLTTAIKNEPQNHHLWLLKARYLYNSQQYQEVIDFCSTAPAINRENIKLYYYLGSALTELKRYPEAKNIFKAMIAVEPQNTLALTGEANIYYHDCNYTAAIDNYQQILDLKPDYSTAWYNIACCYALQRKAPEAIAALQKAIELQPQETRELAKSDRDFSYLQNDSQFQNLIDE